MRWFAWIADLMSSGSQKDEGLVQETHRRLYDVQRRIRDDVGEERLTAAGELASHVGEHVLCTA
jgi:hypothetical protein